MTVDKVPHFTIFCKSFTHRFKDTYPFEQIFIHILTGCYPFKLVDPCEVFVDAVDVKVCVNNKKA